jgi:glycosyltransferase involved in cell wall biosynthesis
VSVALDYLSPLPPIRSGISDYSVDLLPELSRCADVRVLRLEEQAVDDDIATRFAVREPAARAGEGGRLPLYQMGNNHYHARVWELAMERPGVVVLHDLVLHHFLLDRTVGHGAWEPYRDELMRCHGWIGEAVARPVRFGAFGQAGQFELPANRTLLARQRGVLVHGRWAAERLAEDDPRLAVRVVPMGIPLPAAATAEEGLAFRRRRSIPERAPLLGSFGFQTPIKRTDVAIRALARPELAGAHLLVAGELSPYANFEALARRLGVADRVHVTGFLPFDEMHAAIAAADLCLNLRYPSAGETSASLLRILAVGRPVVVSDYAELGDLPATIAIPVPLGDDEDERFVAAVAAVLDDGAATLAAMGERARRHVEVEHAPERAARAVVAAVEELARRQPPGDRPAAPSPRTAVACSRPRGEIAVAGHEAWLPGTRRTLEVELRNLGSAVWLPSDVDPGGVIFEVQLLGERVPESQRPPWLRLQRPLPPGESLRLGLTLRRPFGEARLRILPKVTLGAGYARFGDWRCVQWL